MADIISLDKSAGATEKPLVEVSKKGRTNPTSAFAQRQHWAEFLRTKSLRQASATIPERRRKT